MKQNFLLRVLLAATLLLQSATPLATDNINLPDLGDSSSTVISPAQERRLGENFMRRARQSLAFEDDPELNDYVQRLGQRLLTQSETPGKDFRFFVVNDGSINAFAVPGGFIGIHKGLMLATQSESELASVFAHEITHVTQKHIPRLMAEAQRTTLPAMAAILASVLLASAGHGEGAEAGIALTTAAVVQRGINFTRTYEEEADNLGMTALARAGFDPQGMPAFFERMQTLNRHSETNLPEFLRTHPVTSNRIASARNRAERLPARAGRDSEDYLHAHAKLRAQASNDSAGTVRAFRENLQSGKYRSANAERYGYALALLRNNELDAARTEAKKLADTQPQRVYYRILQAEIEMAAGQANQALSIYDQSRKNAPTHPALLRYYARALLKTNKPDRAYDLLRTAVRQAKDDPTLFRMLAQAAGDSGHLLDAHKAMAEHYYLNGDPKAALEQLRLAQRHAGDNFYQTSSIEARTNEIRQEMALFEEK